MYSMCVFKPYIQSIYSIMYVFACNVNVNGSAFGFMAFDMFMYKQFLYMMFLL